ncbi:hypothetical protein ACWCQZ_41200 [Streptomyces sp. NPDC002285]
MIARAVAVGVICAPFISAALLGLGRAGRALHTRLTRKGSAMNCEDCHGTYCNDCGEHYCCETCPCGLNHTCDCGCRSFERRVMED